MTEFITRNYGNKECEIIIKTDSKEHYKATEDFARRLIDHAKPKTNADRIRAMTGEELAAQLAEVFCKGFKASTSVVIPDELVKEIMEQFLEQLKQPAEGE